VSNLETQVLSLVHTVAGGKDKQSQEVMGRTTLCVSVDCVGHLDISLRCLTSCLLPSVLKFTRIPFWVVVRNNLQMLTRSQLLLRWAEGATAHC